MCAESAVKPQSVTH